MDRPGLSPRRCLHPGAVDGVSGLPLEHPHLPWRRWLPWRCSGSTAGSCPGGSTGERPGTSAATFRVVCRSRWTPSAPSLCTSIPVTRPRRHSAPGARHTANSGTRSGILNWDVRVLQEYGGLQAAMKHSVALEKQARRRAGRGLMDRTATWRTVPPRGDAIPVVGLRLMTVLECA